MILTARKSTYLFILFVICTAIVSCAQETKSSYKILTGADQTNLYVSKLKGKRIAIVANQTSVISNGSNYTHLVDSLVSLKLNIQKVFAPEHGFRGKADAGESIADGMDAKTGLPLISLYGKNKKPTKAQLKDIDLVVFDIQDVGARFYTYISTLHYVMEACAELKIPLLLLDRPNPNGHYIDGPILEPAHKSFVGMHPVPVVYGMTIGEYGLMINGEKWLDNGLKASLTVIKLKNYTHSSAYNLPISSTILASPAFLIKPSNELIPFPFCVAFNSSLNSVTTMFSSSAPYLIPSSILANNFSSAEPVNFPEL